MPSIEDDVKNLLDVLKDIGLDFNWLVAIVSLCAQEIAIKRKLDELGKSYGEENFQKLADRLIKTMEERGIEPPHILLSIARSYRHIRAKIMHDPHKARLSAEESKAIFRNTEALVKSLFKKETRLINIPKFVDSILKFPIDQKVREFNTLDEATKKQVFNAIMDKISLLSWKEIDSYKGLFDFLEVALKMESDPILQNELFEILLRRTLTDVSYGKEKLLAIIAKFTRLTHIRNFIKEKELVEPLITEYETSGSFVIAGWNAEIMLNLAPVFNKKEINRIVDAALSNDQITYSWSARSSLKKFLSLYRKKIPSEKIKKLEEVFKD